MNWIDSYIRSFLKNPWQPVYAIPLLIINAVGSVYGYYWYWDQLTHTAIKMWLFVPDSPLATTLFTVVLGLSLLGYRKPFLDLLAMTANIKYGFWAVFMITDFWAGGGSIRFAESMLWISHLGMAAQGIIYLFWGSGRRFTAPVLFVVSGWMLLNDFFDYYFGIYPYLYYSGQVLIAGISALSMTGVLVLLVRLFLYGKMAKKRWG